ASMVESWVGVRTVAVWERVPAGPGSRTGYLPAEPVHGRMEGPEVPGLTLVGLSPQANPVEGTTDDVRATVPANELIEATVITEVPVALAVAVTLSGLAIAEKSGTATV